MTIKYKENSTYIFLLIMHLIFFLIGSNHMLGNLIYFWIFAYLLTFYVIFTSWFYSGKTIIMDASGCEISFLMFKKRYTWGEFKTKRLELFPNSGNPLRGIVFSTKQIEKLDGGRLPVRYALFSPFMCWFIISFKVEKDDNFKRLNFEIHPYEVDEEEFFNKMHEWGIRIENGLLPQERTRYPSDWEKWL